MTNTFIPVSRDALDGELARVLEPIRLSWTGVSGKGVALTNTAVSDAARYALDAANAGTDKKALRAVADSHSLTVNGSGITLSSAAITGDVTIGGTLEVDGNVTLGDNASDTLTVNAVSTFVAAVNTQAATNLGNGAGDLVTVIDLLKVQNAAGSLVPLYVDGANGRTQVGSTTAMSGASNSVLEVIGGRAYVQPANETLAVGLRYGSGSGTVYLGVTNSADPSLRIVDNGGTEVALFGNDTDTYQLKVTGDVNVTDDAVIGGDLSAGRAVFGATTWSGGEELRVSGQTRLEGEVEITTGDFKMSGSNQKVIADMTTNRLYFQTNGTNAITHLPLIPSGTATESKFLAYNGSDPATAGARMLVGVDTSKIYLESAGTSALEVQIRQGGGVKAVFGSTGIGFNGASQWARTTWTVTNPAADRAFDAAAATLAELRNVVGTIITDLQARGDFA